ncbi:uncharacterized protein LOC110159723 isoform X2 [Boleophthalmus pectinirostris]|uniref:uncharacterized protein LOC110159723 isoform X2 n=1 Tax=Boleophthalmus pectinirostris TaxID=150288 RepID=UPI00242F63E7|nr:uncharacterized protein LOC110159723 isoform X2 [Boleophthalmus pectinirostris]
MANQNIETSSFGNQKQENEECCENVPPVSFLSETGPATPTATLNDKGKPRLSGLQSALTPILKYLNIGNKSPSPLPNLSFNNGPAKPSIASILSFADKKNYASSVLNENLPDITLLDVTCDSTMNVTRNTQCNSAPSSPVSVKEFKKPLQVLDVNLSSKLCPTLTPIHWLHDEILPEMTLLDDTCDSPMPLTRQGFAHSDSVPGTPICETETPKTPTENDVEITSKGSLILTSKPYSSYVMSEKETQILETSDDWSPKKRPLETCEIMLSKTAKLEVSQCSLEKISSTFTGNFTHSISSGSGVSDSIVEDVKKVQLQVTQDISMNSTLESSKSSSENSTQKLEKSQRAVEAPVNITCDLITSNTGCNSINVTSEPRIEPVNTSPGEEPSHISDDEGKNLNKTEYINNTFTTVRGPTATQDLQNRTLDLPTTTNICSSPTAENNNTNMSTKQVTPESNLVLNDHCSGPKFSQNCAMQNQTFEKDSLHISGGSTISEQAGTSIASLQSTFANKPNGTITYTETTAMGDKQHVTPEKSSPYRMKSMSTTDPNPPKILCENIQATTDSNIKPTEPQQSIFNVNTPIEDDSGSPGCSAGSVKAKEQPLCDSIIHHDTFTESHKANTFSLDNTFDFKTDPLVTSTPMPNSKAFIFTVEREEGKTAVAQKKLYGEEPNKPVVQVKSDVPPNIVCDRKTFLPQPTTKQNMLPMKPPSLLSKFKPGSLLPKRHDLPTYGQPMKTNTAQILHQTTEITCSYNLRSTRAATSALKQPMSGLQKPSASSIPSGIHRAGHGLKPPQAKSMSSVPSGSDKPVGGTNPVAKTTIPARKHPLPKTDALPAAKKKKMASLDTAKAKSLKPPSHTQRTLPVKPPKHDFAVPPSDATELTSRFRTLRPPTTSLKAHIAKPLCHSCATCSLLQEQLKLKDEEIKQLKEELLKWSKKEDPAT